MKRVAINQSNYIPWKGYFDMIAAVDEFILYDDMQYTRRDWRNRNKIKSPHGVTWLSVPVRSKGLDLQRIRDTEIDYESDWSRLHWRTLVGSYGRAAYFKSVAERIEPIYLEQRFRFLSELNRALIEAVCEYLGIQTRITNSWDYHLIEGKTVRLADLCVQAGATEYVSGPAAMDYIDEVEFNSRGISLRWFDYNNYPEYPQLWGNFTHAVTILDLLFNCGRDSSQYMRYATA
jgi:WbqC-like protein family